MATRDARGGRSEPETRGALSGTTHADRTMQGSDQTEHHDRWAWRRKIRADPHKARVYRVLIGILGTLLILFGVVSGPLPGPGGIPLVLLGLAIWASEFAWAHRLMQWVKRQLHTFRGWGRPKQVLAWVIFFAVIGALGYADLLVLGIPTWAPHVAVTWLSRLPGVG
ncbi:hypothetical protein GCM10011575_10600 [Microlunatus endophyticus]|uniref:TIGR02611 family protein n=1 Tax=Microlunatus endophyticus TaxID=1716077 RepID=A0A917S329_9ACTN|nr:PGPGW domain-containing protein [Microlunatus endophyticus]GGL54081.1 hypothetical protein GCM10011575_10600 [Microlunatus endophyticus]